MQSENMVILNRVLFFIESLDWPTVMGRLIGAFYDVCELSV